MCIRDRIIGWFKRDFESEGLGKRSWVRPMFLELVWLVGLPLFYLWISRDGLTGGVPTPAGSTTIWFTGYSILFAFLFVATFIDFDQRIIPDSITIPGTLIAIVLAACFPGFRMPIVDNGLIAKTIEPLHYGSAAAMPVWHITIYGLLAGVLIAITWSLALLPKFSLQSLSWGSLKFVFASTIRFLQKNGLKRRAQTRKLGQRILITGVVVAILVAIGWSIGGIHWDSLFGAMIGLGFGGMMVWSVRIVASHSLGQEALGFGDVTLMAMIGAFLGWQPSLIVFALSPFAALAIVVASMIFTKENELAFGPYLCLGAVICIFWWPAIWPMARFQFFQYPLILLGVLAVSLVMLAVMMLGIRVVKGGGYEDEVEEN